MAVAAVDPLGFGGAAVTRGVTTDAAAGAVVAGADAGTGTLAGGTTAGGAVTPGTEAGEEGPSVVVGEASRSTGLGASSRSPACAEADAKTRRLATARRLGGAFNRRIRGVPLVLFVLTMVRRRYGAKMTAPRAGIATVSAPPVTVTSGPPS